MIDLLSLFSVGACGVFVKCGTTWRQCMHVWPSVRTVERCSQVQIFMFSLAIRSERTMYLLFLGVPGVMMSDVIVLVKWVAIMD